jgi:ketosteroid isomerase-like protein
MPAQNVDLVHRMYEAFNRGDWEGAFADTSPEIEWETDPRHPKAGVYRGRAEFQRFMQDFEDPFEQTVIEPEEFFARGDRVVAFIKIRRRPSGSTADVEIRIGELWTVRDGKIVRGQAFGEREKALEAAGLSEEDALGVEP